VINPVPFGACAKMPKAIPNLLNRLRDAPHPAAQRVQVALAENGVARAIDLAMLEMSDLRTF
jgi:hypothetical protein